ncbi:hypothetical protein N7478_011049 [Penicillium angulare]|uniref:uncharacterized protein n=1 Tax=Penicillium angulare TaxID=116970 RepID=UPI00254168EE|nr:uncharacterized protein N7478_011049 [Penicillium angulare]KAJ5263444.1 hypothetical protein N7478_011049 [Penicillium angulare]
MAVKQFTQVSLLDSKPPESSGSAIPISQTNQATRVQAYELYQSRLGDLSRGAERSLATCHPFSPHPLNLAANTLQELRQLHEALDVAITNIVDRWWTDKEADLPSRMPLEPQEVEVLQWIQAKTEKGEMPPFLSHKGVWRPDFLLDRVEDETGHEKTQARICEINARFAFNMLLHSMYGHQALIDLGAQERGLTPAANPENIQDSLFKLFDTRKPVHILKASEDTFTLNLLPPLMAEQTGITPRAISPSDLKLRPNPNSKTGYDLLCRKTQGGTSVCQEDEGFEQIHHIFIHLNQKEISSIPIPMLQHIALRSINDFRSIFFAHDKRMLGIIREELDDLVYKHEVLTPSQANILREGIVYTLIPGSKEINRLIKQSEDSNFIKDKYIIKPIRLGQTEGIIFGDDLTPEEWMSTLRSLLDPELPIQSQSIIQSRIEQPIFDLFVGEEQGVQPTHIVGCYHAIDGRFGGIGVWRTGSGKLCSFDNGGMWIASVIPLLN